MASVRDDLCMASVRDVRCAPRPADRPSLDEVSSLPWMSVDAATFAAAAAAAADAASDASAPTAAAPTGASVDAGGADGGVEGAAGEQPLKDAKDLLDRWCVAHSNLHPSRQVRARATRLTVPTHPRPRYDAFLFEGMTARLAQMGSYE